MNMLMFCVRSKTASLLARNRVPGSPLSNDLLILVKNNSRKHHKAVCLFSVSSNFVSFVSYSYCVKLLPFSGRKSRRRTVAFVSLDHTALKLQAADKSHQHHFLYLRLAKGSLLRWVCVLSFSDDTK